MEFVGKIAKRQVLIRSLAFVLGVATTFGVSAVFGGGDTGGAAPEPKPSGDVVRVKVWEDGSATVLSGTVRIAGESRDAAGMGFCLYGELCTDTGVPFVVQIPPVDGHAPCWGVKTGATVAFCSDGYTVGF